MAQAIIRILDAVEAQARLDDLADILLDAVANGASVNFMAGLERDQARVFWRSLADDVAARRKHLLVADTDGRLAGTVVLSPA